MSTQDDSTQGYALGAVFGIVGLVIAGVIALAASSVMHKQAPAAAVQPSSGVYRVYFESGQDSLSAEASAVLAEVAEGARRDTEAQVLVSGFHDASGDAAANAELAKRRAMQVQHALEANGVAASRVVLAKPALTTGSGDSREARRVEVSLKSEH